MLNALTKSLAALLRLPSLSAGAVARFSVAAPLSHKDSPTFIPREDVPERYDDGTLAQKKDTLAQMLEMGALTPSEVITLLKYYDQKNAKKDALAASDLDKAPTPSPRPR